SAVRALVTEIFDFDGAAALALGRHWEALPPPARAAFTRLYADVVERAYLAWVGSKARVGAGGVTIRWIDEAVEGDAATALAELREPPAGAIASDATPRLLAATLPVASVTRSPTAIAGASWAPRRQFWVQAGAFRDADAATRLVQRLRRHAVTIAISADR